MECVGLLITFWDGFIAQNDCSSGALPGRCVSVPNCGRRASHGVESAQELIAERAVVEGVGGGDLPAANSEELDFLSAGCCDGV